MSGMKTMGDFGHWNNNEPHEGRSVHRLSPQQLYAWREEERRLARRDRRIALIIFGLLVVIFTSVIWWATAR